MRIVDIAVKRPVAVSMFTFAVLLFGKMCRDAGIQDERLFDELVHGPRFP